MNIQKAMLAIAADVAQLGIEKADHNKVQGFDYRGIDRVMNTFSPLLVKHEVFMLPRFGERTITERPTKSGGILFSVTLSGTFEFMADDGSSVTAGPFIGEAMDSGDKATNKAMAIALRYCLLQTFCAPLVGAMEDPDASSPMEAQPIDTRAADWIALFDGLNPPATVDDCKTHKGELVKSYAGTDMIPKAVIAAYNAAYKRVRGEAP